ncbi:endonuclease dU [Methanolacinia paynteri]|uniref:endonuclease dU n=1 Tax=Methanolacinia paynteri TaxID=230356 RepID=UPI00064E23C9|nr:DUF99 family protein [Methanolacinia paynteri]
MKTLKSGVRVLGIAESFVQGANKSVLAGVVMRRDMVIDGTAFGFSTIGGTDATDAVLNIFASLQRKDINYIMLSGCVISWFNIIDPERVCSEINVPVIGVTYEDSGGLADDIMHHFPGDEERLSAYKKLGIRERVILKTGYDVYLRSWGVDNTEACFVCDSFTKEGRIPEPLRVAGIVARAAMRSMVH